MLVLPAMTQDDWVAGEPCIMTPGEDKGMRLLLWMALGLPVPWKPQGLLRTNPSGLPIASVLGDREPSPKACEGGLNMPPCPLRYGDLGPGSPLASLCLEYTGKTSCCCGPHRSGEKCRCPAAIITLNGFLHSGWPSWVLFLIARGCVVGVMEVTPTRQKVAVSHLGCVSLLQGFPMRVYEPYGFVLDLGWVCEIVIGCHLR